MPIKLVPNNEDAPAMTLSSHAYSVIRLCLAAYDLVGEECTCGECDVSEREVFRKEDVPQICVALGEIFSHMIDAGLRDRAIETALLLSALPTSGGMHTEKTDD
jgi:hypothetical protein